MAGIHFDITGDNEQVLKSLQQTMEAITQLGNKTEDAGGQIDKSTKKMSGLSKELASMATRYLSWAAAIGVFTKGIKDALKLNAEFEKKNSELAAVLGTTRKGVEELSKSAEDLGRKTMFTASQVTELQVALARLGFTEGQIKDMQGSVLKFAAAVNTDLASASAFTGSVLRGFGLEAKDTTHLLDVMASATSKSALDFRKLEVSMSTVAPVAKAFGLTVEDAVALLGALSNAGFEASRSAMAAKNILLNFADANGKIAKSLGHAAQSFPEIISALQECTEKGISLSEALEMTDQQSVAAFTALINGADAANQLRDALGNCDGTLNDMYDTMTDNLIGAVDELKSAWQGLMLEFQESNGTIATMLRGLAKGINLMKDWADYAQANKKEPTQFGERLSWILPGYKGAKNIFNGIKNLSAVLNQDNEQAMMDAIKNSGEFKSLEDYDKMIGEVTSALESKDYKGNKKKDLERYRDALVKLRGEAWANAMNSGLESLIAELEGSGNGTGGGGGHTNLTDEQKKAIANYKKAYEKVVSQLWKSVADTSVAAMKEGHAKELAEIENERRQSLAAIDEEVKELEEAAKGAGIKVSQEVYDQYEQKRLDTNTIAANKVVELEKKRQKELNESRWQYLEQYGSFREKELAITEKYDAEIAEAKDTYARYSLQREKENALRELEQANSSKYSMIFADAESLSNSVLQQAIEATQEAIEEAKDSGDIQALTELYSRLREQMNIQGERQRGWGWNGIAEGFSLRGSAIAKRAQADSLEKLLRDSEDSIEVMKELGLSEEDIEASRKEIEALRAEIKKLRDDANNDDANALGFIQNGFREVADTISVIGSEMSSFRDGLGGVCDTIADIGDGLSEIATQADSIQKAFSGDMGKAEAWSTAISGTVQMIAMIGRSIADNRRAQQEWNKTIEESEQKMRMLKLEALDYKEQNIFGVENPYKKAIDGALQYSAAMKNLQEIQSKLAGGKVQTGTKKAVDWKNVGTGTAAGAAAGASIGSIFPGIGTAIGTAVGAGIGAIAGLLSTKTVPVFESLLSQYGQLFNPDTYELNQQLIADYDKLDEETKQIVDNWDEIRDKALEAEKAMEDNFKEIAGSLGSDLSNSLVEAFKNGKLNSAIDDFHGKVSDTIEDIIQQMVFSTVFGDMFDNLQAEMKESFGAGGDQNLVDDIMRFTDSWQEGLQTYGEQMEEARQYMKEAGYDILNNKSQRQAASRSSLGASQDSIDESNGRLTAIQGHTYEINENVRRLVAMAGAGGAVLPTDMGMTGGVANDISPVLRELSMSLTAQAGQLAEMGNTVSALQEDVAIMRQMTEGIETNTAHSVELNSRMKGSLDTVLDKGVKMM